MHFEDAMSFFLCNQDCGIRGYFVLSNLALGVKMFFMNLVVKMRLLIADCTVGLNGILIQVSDGSSLDVLRHRDTDQFYILTLKARF